MLRPSHHGEAAHRGMPGPTSPRKKDPMRGIDPERLDRLSAAIDRQMGEMCSLFRGDKPVRGHAAGRLMMLARVLQLTVETFAGEVEDAL